MQQPFQFAGQPQKPAHGYSAGNSLPYNTPAPIPAGKPWWWKPPKKTTPYNAPVTKGGAQNSPYGTQQGSSPFGAQPEYGYQSGPAITPGGPPARPIEEHPIYGPPGWNPQLGRDDNMRQQQILQLLAQRQFGLQGKLQNAGIQGNYRFGVSNSPGRIGAVQQQQSSAGLVPYASASGASGGPYGGGQSGLPPQLLALLQQLQGQPQQYGF